MLAANSVILELTLGYPFTAYFVRQGDASQAEIAICQKISDHAYEWEYHNIGGYSRFSEDHFIDTPNGLDIRMDDPLMICLLRTALSLSSLSVTHSR